MILLEQLKHATPCWEAKFNSDSPTYNMEVNMTPLLFSRRPPPPPVTLR